MIKNITVGNIKAITKPVTIDFKYKNIKNEDYMIFNEIIDNKTQTWTENKVRLVTCILGKNGSGKSSIGQALSMNEQFNPEILSRSIFYNFMNELKMLLDEIGGSYHEKYITKSIDVKGHRALVDDVEISITGNVDEGFLSKPIADILWKSLASSIKERCKAVGAKENTFLEFIKNDSKIKYSFSDGRVYKNIDGEEFDLFNNLRSLVIPKICTRNFEDKTYITFNFSWPDIFNSIFNFFQELSDSFTTISIEQRRIRNSMDFRRVKSINHATNELAKLTSYDFVENLLKMIDPQIEAAIKKDIDNSSLLLKIKNEEVPISLTSLSSGTQNLIFILKEVLIAMKKGKFIFIDEMDNGLQVRMAKMLIDIFLDETINKNGSQLLFTTHSIIYMLKEYIAPKNHMISFRNNDGVVAFNDYWSILKDTRIEYRRNILKYFFEENAFKQYPFLVTKKDRDKVFNNLRESYQDEKNR